MNLRLDHNTKRNEYIKELFGQEDSTLNAARSSIDEQQKHMCLSPNEAKILEVLIKLGGYKKLVEIGTLSGYTSIRIARAAGKEAQIYTLEKMAANAENARNNIKNSDVASRIEVIEGDAHEELSKLSEKGPFDLVFIDADKAGYPKYLDWAEKNVRKGGLIVGDNTFLFGNVFADDVPERSEHMAKAMREFNQRLADSTKYTGIILPTDEGMTVAIKNF